MPRQSKGFKELLLQQRASEDKYKMVEKVRRQMQSGNYGEVASEVIIDPEGMEKMSEVLRRFIAPYVDNVENIQYYKNFLSIGVLAWNLTVVPEDKQQEMKDMMLSEMFAEAPSEIQHDIEEILDDLIARKKKYFSSIKRFVVDFKVKDTGRDYNLSVVSTLVDTQE
jgi:DNA primase catalytic subunit